MTMRDLLIKCDKREMYDKYIQICGDVPIQKYNEVFDKLSTFTDDLLNEQVNESENDILILYTAYNGLDNEKYPDTSVFSIKDIKEFFQPLAYFDELEDQDIELLSDEQVKTLWDIHYTLLEKKDKLHPEKSHPGIVEGKAYYFCDWSEILGFLVPDYIIKTEYEAVFAAVVLYEISFFGFDKEDMIKERNRLNESIEEMEKIKELPEEEQKKHLISQKDFDELCNAFSDDCDDDLKYDDFKVIKSMLFTQISIYRSLKKMYIELNSKDQKIERTHNDTICFEDVKLVIPKGKELW